MSTVFRLIVPQRVHVAMVQQAVAELPNECCGLMAGRVADGIGRVERLYPLVNAAASPVLYESEPRSMLDAYRDLTGRGLDVLAVYHSHPTSPPVPSRTDLARNYSEDVVNLIVSLAGGEPEVGGWWLTERDCRRAEWEVEAGDPPPMG